MKCRKKPIVVEAFKWTGDYEQTEDPEWAVEAMVNGGMFVSASSETLVIRTLEGNMTADSGDYIIRGVQGEIYPCKPDIFEATYDIVEE